VRLSSALAAALSGILEQLEQQAKNASVPPSFLMLLPREVRNDANAIAEFFAPAKRAFGSASYSESSAPLGGAADSGKAGVEDDVEGKEEVEEGALDAANSS
jgi:hypothetical protein